MSVAQSILANMSAAVVQLIDRIHLNQLNCVLTNYVMHPWSAL